MKEITIEQFCLLPKQLQSEALYKDGVFIGKKKMSGKTFMAFQLHGFYVEVHFGQYRQTIVSLKCSPAVSLAESYLQQVNVEELVNVGD